MDGTRHIFYKIGKILFASFSIFLVFLNILIVGIAVNHKKNITKLPPEFSPGTDQFANCQSLAENCGNGACQYYNLCQTASSDYKICKVYDCDKNYGVEIKTKNDELLAKIYEKVSVATAKQNIEACKGSIKIIGSKCEKSISTVKVEVSTAGDCPIEAFVFQQDGQFNPAVFSNSGKDYSLAIPSCKPVTAINAIGPNGLLVGSATLNK